MRNEMLTDEQVELEIARLWNTPEVKLAKKEQNLKYKRRQQLYQLRIMEKRGAQLILDGVTMENIEDRLFGDIHIE